MYDLFSSVLSVSSVADGSFISPLLISMALDSGLSHTCVTTRSGAERKWAFAINKCASVWEGKGWMGVAHLGQTSRCQEVTLQALDPTVGLGMVGGKQIIRGMIGLREEKVIARC